MKKIIITIAVIIAVFLATIGVLTSLYTNSESYSGETFTKGTIINGVDCSDLTYKEAAAKLTNEWNSNTIVVKGKLGEKLDSYSDFGCTYNIYSQLSALKKSNVIAAALNYYTHLPFKTQVAMKVVDYGDEFSEAVKSSSFLSRSSVVETSDAYVDMTDPDFPIVPEVYGNKTDVNAYLDDILKAISTGNFIFEYDENSYTSVPSVKADDKELLEFQAFCQKYLNQKIVYNFGDESFTLTAEELCDLMKDDNSGNPDSEAVAKFVEQLKSDYDIIGGEKSFTSLTGKTFNVSTDSYGWVIDYEGEIAQLEEDITSHKDVNREPVYSQKGNGEYSSKLELGDTYIDVDITKQHVVYFENGKQKFECDCVTGNWSAGHSTPTGVFSILGKSRNITLTSGGKKSDPGYYSSFVSYWMPFLGSSYGLHDASWRSSFGGEIYKYGGSHGCVNLPPSKASKLYNMISVGTYVIIHY